MNRKASTVLLGVTLIAIAGFFAWQIPSKINYDKSRNQLLLEAPPLAIHPLDTEAAGFLQSVRESWEVLDHECPDSIFSEISSATGVDESAEGVVRFHAHEIPEYSFFNLRRNADELVMAIALAVALPTSVDQRIYSEEGLCFIKLGETLVEVYEDSDEGLSRTRYWKSTTGENARANDSR